MSEDRTAPPPGFERYYASGDAYMISAALERAHYADGFDTFTLAEAWAYYDALGVITRTRAAAELSVLLWLAAPAVRVSIIVEPLASDPNEAAIRALVLCAIECARADGAPFTDKDELAVRRYFAGQRKVRSAIESLASKWETEADEDGETVDARYGCVRELRAALAAADKPSGKNGGGA